MVILLLLEPIREKLCQFSFTIVESDDHAVSTASAMLSQSYSFITMVNRANTSSLAVIMLYPFGGTGSTITVIYPGFTVICGEYQLFRPTVYQDGKRVFGLCGPDSSSTAAKVRMTDELVEELNRWIKEDEPESENTP